MGFFDNMKQAAANIVTKMIDPAMIAELLPQAKGGIIQMIADEETAQAMPVFAVICLSENKADILLSLYKMHESGQMEKYKDIDLADTSALLKIITNGITPPQHPAIGQQTQPSPNTGTDSPASDAPANS
jgi:hypothetical protein